MKIEELTDAIGAIDLKYVEEAERWRGTKKRLLFRTMIPLAACLCLVAYGIYGMPGRRGATGAGESAGGVESAAEQTADNTWESAGQNADGGAAEAGGMADGAESGGGTPQTGGTGQGQEADDLAAGCAEMAVEEGQKAKEGATQIRLNEVQTFSSTIYDIAAPERVEWFQAEELAQYYGTVVVPERLPEGLVPEGADEARYAVAYDAKDKVVDDNNTLTFSDESGRRVLDISARTVERAGEVVSFADDGLAVSLINGREVTIGHYRGKDGDDYFLAVFEVCGVRFTVQSTNLTEAELADVLSMLA